jgi:pyruvate ferredoxin oxidoreductase alpha subunit
MQTLGTGWLTLMAHNVQEVYDMNIIALKWAEKVQLPCLVVYDGFFTSHGTRRINIFKDWDDVKGWVGPKPPRPTVLDMHDPVAFDTERSHVHPLQLLPGHRLDRISPDLRDLHRHLQSRVGTRASNDRHFCYGRAVANGRAGRCEILAPQRVGSYVRPAATRAD